MADINGGAGTHVSGVAHRGRDTLIAWLKQAKVVFGDDFLVHDDLLVQGAPGAADGILGPAGRKAVLEGTGYAIMLQLKPADHCLWRRR